MLGIFQGRGLFQEGEGIYAQIDVNMREHLHEFNTGKSLNPLGVFLAIALHADKDGWAWPSRQTIKDETGIRGEAAITRSLKHLRNMRINGQRVFAHYRVQKDGQWGQSAYLIFPDLPHGDAPFDDMIEFTTEKSPPYDNPHVDCPHVDNHALQGKPSSEEKKSSAANAPPPPPQAVEDAQGTQEAQAVEAQSQTLQDVLALNVKAIKAWAKGATQDERKALVALESKKDKPRQGVLDIAGVVNQRIFNGALYIAYGYQNGDTSFLNKGQVVNLYREARRIEEKGITADDLLRFNEWWQKSNEWRGCGPYLLRKPSLILTKWAEFTAQQQVIRRQAQQQAARYADIEVFG